MSSKTSNDFRPKKSTTKPILIITLGFIVALAIALGLSNQLINTTTSVIDSASEDVLHTKGTPRGPQNAALKLSEFGDYQCPACQRYQQILNKLFQLYPNEVQLEFHHFPLMSIHPAALAAAKAAESAREQGRFWEMHELLFKNQTSWAETENPETLFLTLAAQLGLDQNEFMRSMRSTTIQARILDDVKRARELGIASVPAFFVEGLPIDLPEDVEGFEALVREAIKRRQ